MERDGNFLGLGGRDAYEILGISPVATTSEVRAARRARQKAVHPDRQGDAELSKLVNYAAEILLNDATRRSYDEYRYRNGATAPRPRAEPGRTPQPAWTPPPAAQDLAASHRGYGGMVVLGLLTLVVIAVCVGTGVLDKLIDRLTGLIP